MVVAALECRRITRLVERLAAAAVTLQAGLILLVAAGLAAGRWALLAGLAVVWAVALALYAGNYALLRHGCG